MSAENQHNPQFISLQYELNYQRQLMNFRKRAGAGLNELSLIERRIKRLLTQLAQAARPSPGKEDPDFFNSSNS
jgi:hypothetical protein